MRTRRSRREEKNTKEEEEEGGEKKITTDRTQMKRGGGLESTFAERISQRSFKRVEAKLQARTGNQERRVGRKGKRWLEKRGRRAESRRSFKRVEAGVAGQRG